MRMLVLEAAAALALAVAVVATGVLVVETKHKSRHRFAELQEVKRETDRLQIDWGRLQLEQSAYATHARIESFAHEQLELAEPAPEQLRMVEHRP